MNNASSFKTWQKALMTLAVAGTFGAGYLAWSVEGDTQIALTLHTPAAVASIIDTIRI